MGTPHFFSTFFVCLYNKYFLEKISQLFLVFRDVEAHEDKKNKTKTPIRYFSASRKIL